ncbi:protein of unknown function [Amycolatopsis pretoriensis]|uniref:DUF397 domain-containing protein n=1 Tax=Amycolatopsis pretoriensis TaxID=218821 RepID=A0A1H5QQW5_9PSEU|nr:DUF397 domain-containing protein [Amycolatopsis pretoriensis]SEF28506.1 protein of unknown function [Amycolatopsis pretoriensis]
MRWQKSTYSGANENCVEVALDQVVRIRDTKDRPAGTLEISTRSWDAFLADLAR